MKVNTVKDSPKSKPFAVKTSYKTKLIVHETAVKLRA